MGSFGGRGGGLKFGSEHARSGGKIRISRDTNKSR